VSWQVEVDDEVERQSLIYLFYFRFYVHNLEVKVQQNLTRVEQEEG
jgi:hypothetical protein